MVTVGPQSHMEEMWSGETVTGDMPVSRKPQSEGS